MDIRSTPLVAGALEARRPTHWWLAWPLVIWFFLFAPIVLFNSPPASLSAIAWFHSGMWEAVPFGISLGLLALWVVRKERRPFASIGFRGLSKVRRLLVGLGAGVASMAGIALALFAMGAYRVGAPGAALHGTDAIVPALMMLAAVGVQATAEEAAFRGYLLQVTGTQLPAWPTVILTALAFAGAHPSASVVGMINIVLVALFFTFVSLAQGSIWTAAGFHIGWNWAQGSLLGVPVSGIPQDLSIVVLGPVDTAPAWLTGGTFGIEASVAATALLGVLAGWGYLYFTRSKGGALETNNP